MNELVVNSGLPEWFAARGSWRQDARPSFIELLRVNLRGVGSIQLANGLDRNYLRLFQGMLEGKRSVDWNSIKSSLGTRDNVLADLPEFVYVYIPASVRNPTDLDVQFFSVRDGDVVIGTMNAEEMAIFGNAIDVACNVTDIVVSLRGAGRADHPDSDAWVSGLTPVAYLYWVLLWCSIVWRLEDKLQHLQGSYELEVRQGWQVVACRHDGRVIESEHTLLA